MCLRKRTALSRVADVGVVAFTITEKRFGEERESVHYQWRPMYVLGSVKYSNVTLPLRLFLPSKRKPRSASRCQLFRRLLDPEKMRLHQKATRLLQPSLHTFAEFFLIKGLQKRCQTRLVDRKLEGGSAIAEEIRFRVRCQIN